MDFHPDAISMNVLRNRWSAAAESKNPKFRFTFLPRDTGFSTNEGLFCRHAVVITSIGKVLDTRVYGEMSTHLNL